MTLPSALLWDVDGTIAETERDGHRVAFNQAFRELGLPWQWSEPRYGELLDVTGGRERVLHDMQTRNDAPLASADREALAREIHERKNAAYARLVREGRVRPRDGVLDLMRECRAHRVSMAIVTTTSRANVEALLGAHIGASWTSWFDAVVCGEDTRRKKPDPEVYALALERLRLRPSEVIAIEDSPHGVAAARAAGVTVLVTRSAYFATAAVDGAVAVGPGLHRREGWRPAVEVFSDADEPITLYDIGDWWAGGRWRRTG